MNGLCAFMQCPQSCQLRPRLGCKWLIGKMILEHKAGWGGNAGRLLSMSSEPCDSGLLHDAVGTLQNALLTVKTLLSLVG